MPLQTEAQANDDMRCFLRTLDADVQACLALNRATLRALAALSPLLSRAAEAACEDEAGHTDSPRVAEVLEHVRERLSQTPSETRMASALERALADAAEALSDRAGRSA